MGKSVGDGAEALFLGQFEHALDGKNRLFIPVRFREHRQPQRFILTRGLERCLYLFPVVTWRRLANRLDQLPIRDKREERAFKRAFLAWASEVSLDPQGRILIPHALGQYAGIRQDAVVIGVLQHIEVWAKERWRRYVPHAEGSFQRLAPHLEL
ncbi:MAG: division/cell wall cluster transcriptional repressor MraZ [Elusimicrobia bacterium]|nr:division/cell wall cluster transcriptional repressor MraZ [Elusimicrobiota bacterium]